MHALRTWPPASDMYTNARKSYTDVDDSAALFEDRSQSAAQHLLRDRFEVNMMATALSQVECDSGCLSTISPSREGSVIISPRSGYPCICIHDWH